MAKIKSTLDLIMEKTKNMSLNDEETKVLRQRDLEERVKIFTYRFIKNERDNEDTLVTEIEKIPEEEQEEARMICVNILAGEFSPFDENPRILHGIQKVIGRIPDERFHDRVEALRKEFKRKEEALRKESTMQCYKELESEGIRGSALIPHIDSTSFWQVESKKLIVSFREALLEKLKPAFQS